MEESALPRRKCSAIKHSTDPKLIILGKLVKVFYALSFPQKSSTQTPKRVGWETPFHGRSIQRLEGTRQSAGLLPHQVLYQ